MSILCRFHYRICHVPRHFPTCSNFFLKSFVKSPQNAMTNRIRVLAAQRDSMACIRDSLSNFFMNTFSTFCLVHQRRRNRRVDQQRRNFLMNCFHRPQGGAVLDSHAVVCRQYVVWCWYKEPIRFQSRFSAVVPQSIFAGGLQSKRSLYGALFCALITQWSIPACSKFRQRNTSHAKLRLLVTLLLSSCSFRVLCKSWRSSLEIGQYLVSHTPPPSSWARPLASKRLLHERCDAFVFSFHLRIDRVTMFGDLSVHCRHRSNNWTTDQ